MTVWQERQVLILTVVFTVVLAIFTLLASGGDWVTTLLVMPIVASVSFWSLRLSMRFGRRFAPPVPTQEEPPAEAPSTTDRPQHAQRRRSRRRPRGRRR